MESKLKREWSEVLLQEEMLWMQTSCVDWIRHDDKNRKFLHTSTLVQGGGTRLMHLKMEMEVGWKIVRS